MNRIRIEPSTRPHAWYSRSSLQAAIAGFALAASLAGCGPGGGGEDANTTQQDAAAAFAIETVEVGVLFDEPVSTGEATGDADTMASLPLNRAGEDVFDGSLQVFDAGGRASSLRVELRLAE